MSNRQWEIKTSEGVEKVEGSRVLIAGYLDCIVHLRKRLTFYHAGEVLVTELSTGAAIGGGDSENDAISDAEQKVKESGKRKVHRLLQIMYKKYGEVNQGVW